MHLKLLLSYLIFILFSVASCKDSHTIDGFEAELWAADKDGCKFIRFDYLEILMDNQDRLLNRSQNSIESLLGLPDEHELDSRRQKFFYYYVEPGPECLEPLRHPVRLQIRFNAVGLSSEVFFENI